jgi:hypothetical protein
VAERNPSAIHVARCYAVWIMTHSGAHASTVILAWLPNFPSPIYFIIIRQLFVKQLSFLKNTLYEHPSRDGSSRWYVKEKVGEATPITVGCDGDLKNGEEYPVRSLSLSQHCRYDCGGGRRQITRLRGLADLPINGHDLASSFYWPLHSSRRKEGRTRPHRLT